MRQDGFFIGMAWVDPAAHTIDVQGRVTRVQPRVMKVLLRLIERPGEVVTREELLEAGWAYAYASDAGLTKAISQLRHALGDQPRQPTILETIPKVGYRVIGTVVADGLPQGAGSSGQAAADDQNPAPRTERVYYSPWSWGIAAAVVLLVVQGLWVRSQAENASVIPPQTQRYVMMVAADSIGAQEQHVLRDSLRGQVLREVDAFSDKASVTWTKKMKRCPLGTDPCEAVSSDTSGTGYGALVQALYAE